MEGDERSLITMGLRPMLTDETLSHRVKMSICQLCVALADHGYVQPDGGGQYIIQFLLTNLVLKPEAAGTTVRREFCSWSALLYSPSDLCIGTKIYGTNNNKFMFSIWYDPLQQQ